MNSACLRQKILDGLDPDQAFAGLPPLTAGGGDLPGEMAGPGQEAGLARELACRNDEAMHVPAMAAGKRPGWAWRPA